MCLHGSLISERGLEMVDTAWTFTVIFIAIGGTLATFAVMWLRSEHPGSDEREPRSRLGDDPRHRRQRNTPRTH
jgi:hypothetical protein